MVELVGQAGPAATRKPPVHYPQDPDRSALARYLTEIRRRPSLSREEEVGLARRARDGNQQALNVLVEANLGFVVKIACEYRNLGLPLEDLLNEGNLGLLKAAQRFDAERGNKFITFAVWWIRKAILSALNEHVGLVRMPENQRRKLRRIREAEQSLVRTLGRIPEREEVASALSHTPAEMDTTLRHNVRSRSLTDPVGPDSETSLSDLLTDDRAATGEEDMLRREATGLVVEALKELDAQERQVLGYRFGLHDRAPLVLREVGALMGVSRERVRQIEVKATQRLRRILLRRMSASPRSSLKEDLRRTG
jgi:RNA polymerase primary sigma factor